MKNKHVVYGLAWVIILAAAIYLRSGGLFRGLENGAVYHPDSPKQVLSFHNYLNNRYVWYDGSLFIDGYPLFLNHVDEWFVRPLYLATEAIGDHLFARQQPVSSRVTPQDDYYPNGIWLFYCTRFLRFFYSLCIVFIGYGLARILKFRRELCFLVALLLALSPIELVVSHAATGDIGVDLFGGLLLLFLALYSRSQRGWWLLPMGIAGGFSFASKYHGLMMSAATGIFLFVFWMIQKRDVRKMLTHGFLYAVYLVAGIIVATPQFFINPKKTRRLIFENFEFLKNYKVPEHILEKSWYERAVIGFEKNTIFVLHGLGYLLIILALAGLILSVVVYIRKRRGKDQKGIKKRHKKQDFRSVFDPANAVLQLSIYSLPFICIFFSLAGKYNVQPFHFSYLVLPLILSAVSVLHRLLNRNSRGGRLVAMILAILLVSITGLRAAHESHFWVRQDSGETMKLLYENTMDWRNYDDIDHGIVKRINTEDDNLPMFRNRIRELYMPNAGFWNRMHIAPVPAIPFPQSLYWIFCNGPVYPRSDRMFTVPVNECVEKSLMFTGFPQQVKLGIRSGGWSVRAEVRCGSDRQGIILAPNNQQVITLARDNVVPIITNSTTHPDAWRLPIKVKTEMGALWATVILNEREEQLFRLFGGQAGNRPVWSGKLPFSNEDITRQVEQTAYYANQENKTCWLPAGQQEMLLCFEPLAGGVYKFRAEIITDMPGSEVVLTGSELFSDNSWSNTVWQKPFPLHEGLNVIEHSFSKYFMPYQYCLALRCSKGTAERVGWQLKPDTLTILKNLQSWAAGGDRPEWSRPHNPVLKEATPNMPYGITFGNAFELTRLQIPVQSGENGCITLYASLNQVNPHYHHPHEAVVFIHLEDEETGETRGVVGFPASQALQSGKTALPITCILNQPVQGRLRIRIGMLSSRTGIRLPVQTPDANKYPVKQRKIDVGVADFAQPEG